MLFSAIAIAIAAVRQAEINRIAILAILLKEKKEPLFPTLDR